MISTKKFTDDPRKHGSNNAGGGDFSNEKRIGNFRGEETPGGAFSEGKIMPGSLAFMESHFPFELDRNPSEKGFSRCGLVHKKSASAKL